MSHDHGDHTGNANDFQASTWLVNKAEHDAMFAEPPPRICIAGHLQRAQEQQDSDVPLQGDYDVFGDGTVVIKPTPGHTPGHLALVVKLAKTGRSR